MNSKLIYLFVFVLLGLCDSAFVDTLGKCTYKDGPCVGGLVEQALKDIKDDGIPELKIPPIDPLDLENITVPVLGLFNLTLDKGQIKGIKNCVVNSIHNDLNKGVTNLDVTCSITAKAKFKLSDISPTVQNLLGENSVTADAYINTKLDKLRLKIKFFYDVIQNSDGDFFFKCYSDKLRYEFELDNFKMKNSKVVISKIDISEFVQTFMNQNWRTVFPTIGRAVLDTAMAIVSELVTHFFLEVPTKYFYTDDLSSFVKN